MIRIRNTEYVSILQYWQEGAQNTVQNTVVRINQFVCPYITTTPRAVTEVGKMQCVASPPLPLPHCHSSQLLTLVDRHVYYRSSCSTVT